jgi:chromosomal replication initiator protein
MSPLSTWEKAREIIKDKIGLTTYETWFSTLHFRELNPQTLVIETPDEFFKNWIVEHYSSLISDTLKEISAEPIRIDYEVNANIIKKEAPYRLPPFERNFERPSSPQAHLNPRFTFDNFVIGSSNRFAHAASMAVGESPAKAYNPLFIYGGVGLGKTHLMQAITHKIQEKFPTLQHCYISSERFTNELIDAIRHRSTNQFRQKYRNIDVLLIDDIHFIAGKESTQEEFFHTFNALHDSRKQIIISSDRPPKEISRLEERLSSRFAWGVITDIQPPDFETRVAILRKKIEREPVQVPDNVLTFIAQEIKTNIRELEGALIRVVAYSLLEEKPVSLEMAKLILKDLVQETVMKIDVEKVLKAVAEVFNVSLLDIKAPKRNKNIVLPRQVAMYLSRKLTTLSLPEIGYAFGGKDHTTVLHSCRKIEKSIIADTELNKTIEKLSTILQRY